MDSRIDVGEAGRLAFVVVVVVVVVCVVVLTDIAVTGIEAAVAVVFVVAAVWAFNASNRARMLCCNANALALGSSGAVGVGTMVVVAAVLAETAGTGTAVAVVVAIPAGGTTPPFSVDEEVASPHRLLRRRGSPWRLSSGPDMGKGENKPEREGGSGPVVVAIAIMRYTSR